MNDFPELSVIIPVYNVQSELRTCLDSVINQSYLNMEIIVINDASTDGSAHIIEEYAAKYQLIKPVFLQHNIGVGGRSKSRNCFGEGTLCRICR